MELALREAESNPKDALFVHLGHWHAPPTVEPSAQEWREGQLRLNEELLVMAAMEDGMDVLDVGCGLGGTLSVLNARHRRLHLVGLNHDLRQLYMARRIVPREANRLAWYCGDACFLPYRARSFARVLCIEAIFHFSSRHSFMAEATRVLRPGGLLVLSDILINYSAPEFAAEKLDRETVEVTLRSGMGPWPDLWGEQADYDALAALVGLEPVQTIDATAATLPSHHCILSGPEPNASGRDPVRRASEMLAWLHRNGHLRVLYKSFQAR